MKFTIAASVLLGHSFAGLGGPGVDGAIRQQEQVTRPMTPPLTSARKWNGKIANTFPKAGQIWRSDQFQLENHAKVLKNHNLRNFLQKEAEASVKNKKLIPCDPDLGILACESEENMRCEPSFDGSNDFYCVKTTGDKRQLEQLGVYTRDFECEYSEGFDYTSRTGAAVCSFQNCDYGYCSDNVCTSDENFNWNYMADEQTGASINCTYIYPTTCAAYYYPDLTLCTQRTAILYRPYSVVGDNIYEKNRGCYTVWWEENATDTSEVCLYYESSSQSREPTRWASVNGVQCATSTYLESDDDICSYCGSCMASLDCTNTCMEEDGIVDCLMVGSRGPQDMAKVCLSQEVPTMTIPPSGNSTSEYSYNFDLETDCILGEDFDPDILVGSANCTYKVCQYEYYGDDDSTYQYGGPFGTSVCTDYFCQFHEGFDFEAGAGPYTCIYSDFYCGSDYPGEGYYCVEFVGTIDSDGIAYGLSGGCYTVFRDGYPEESSEACLTFFYSDITSEDAVPDSCVARINNVTCDSCTYFEGDGYHCYELNCTNTCAGSMAMTECPNYGLEYVGIEFAKVCLSETSGVDDDDGDDDFLEEYCELSEDFNLETMTGSATCSYQVCDYSDDDMTYGEGSSEPTFCSDFVCEFRDFNFYNMTGVFECNYSTSVYCGSDYPDDDYLEGYCVQLDGTYLSNDGISAEGTFCYNIFPEGDQQNSSQICLTLYFSEFSFDDDNTDAPEPLCKMSIGDTECITCTYLDDYFDNDYVFVEGCLEADCTNTCAETMFGCSTNITEPAKICLAQDRSPIAEIEDPPTEAPIDVGPPSNPPTSASSTTICSICPEGQIVTSPEVVIFVEEAGQNIPCSNLTNYPVPPGDDHNIFDHGTCFTSLPDNVQEQCGCAPPTLPPQSRPPVAAPVGTQAPVAAPVAIQAPVAAPVATQAPVAEADSPVATQAPTRDPNRAIVCVDGFQTPGCNANALSSPVVVFHDPLSAEEKECVTEGDMIKCPVDIEVSLEENVGNSTHLDVSIACPAGSSVAQSDLSQTSRDPDACECLIDVYNMLDPPEQTMGQGPSRPSTGNGSPIESCQCMVCPPGSIAKFAATCTEAPFFGCKSWGCSGICNDEPNFIATTPTVAPTEPYVPDDPLECLEGYEVDGKCMANALSEPVLVFDGGTSESCTIDNDSEVIKCPINMEMSVLGGENATGLMYSISTTIVCPLEAVQDVGFTTATKIPGVCTSETELQTDEDIDSGERRLQSEPEVIDCDWHACPSDALSPASVICKTELVGPCHGFSCNGACDGEVDYLPPPPTEDNPNPAAPLLFRDPLLDGEKEKTIDTVTSTVTWASDMVITTVTIGEDLNFYIDGQFTCPLDDDSGSIQGNEQYFDLTRDHGNCFCDVSVLDPGPNAGSPRSLDNCQCHTCLEGQSVATFALVCESDVIPGCKSLSCDGLCNGDMLFFPSPAPTQMPSDEPTKMPSMEPPPSVAETAAPTIAPATDGQQQQPTDRNTPSDDDGDSASSPFTTFSWMASFGTMLAWYFL